MADEWDNLIPDRKERPINGSFNTNKGRRKIKSSEASDEESLLSDKEYIVTEYVMEYTDIFEASMEKSQGNETKHDGLANDDDSASDKEIIDRKDHKSLAFLDVQDGDTVTEVKSDVTGYTAEGYLYENTNAVESDESSSEGYPDIPEDHGDDEEQIEEHRDIRLPSLDEHEPEKEEFGSESELITTQMNSIDIASQDELSMSPRSEDDHLEDKVEQVNDHEVEERVEEVIEDEETENDSLLVKKQDKVIKKIEKPHSNKEVPKTQSERRSLLTSSPEPLPSEEDHPSVKQHRTNVPSSTTRKTHSPHGAPVKKKAVPKNAEGEKISTQAKDKNLQRSSHKKTVASPSSTEHDLPTKHHTRDSSTSTQTSSSMNQSSPKEKKPFSPKAYPGKVVKSVAIGTDNDNEIYRSHDTDKNGIMQNETNGRVREKSERKQTTEMRKGGKASRKHLHRDGGEMMSENDTSDAHFFKGRLTQTSKRPPKRHVWLCRDGEIHRLIAEKASVLRRFKDEGITSGKRKSKGFPNYSEVDVLGLPSVGFSGQTKDDSHRSSLPYSKHPSSRSNQENHDTMLSEDDDERTNRVGVKTSKSSGGTFAVGLASRRDKHLKNKHDSLPSKDDHLSDENGDGCELCAAEAREKEKHEKKLKELEEAAKAGPHHPRNLMLGIVYSAKFLGSTNLMSPNAPNKSVRLKQAQEAINRIKVPEGEEQPTSDVDLFISTERIKVVSAEQKQTLIDHHLKTISFIADIGKIIVVMARLSMEDDTSTTWSGKMPDFSSPNTDKTAKVICHVLETDEAQTVAKTVGQAFSIAYHEFLKVNRLNVDELEEAEYNGILEQQKILGEELTLLADETKTKEVVIHKKYGEGLSMMIVESGWGSMIPTVVIAHLDNKGVAAKSGQLNVGNQILAVNNQSLVGLPLLECQNIIKAMKYEERVSLKVVCCPPTVEICVNRPDTKYQLGFSVQNGMICSLMRGGIAERGGVRVGHKIIELNGESVVAASHHHIVDILQTKIGELQMKTMPITLYKLLVGLEIPQYL